MKRLTIAVLLVLPMLVVAGNQRLGRQANPPTGRRR